MTVAASASSRSLRSPRSGATASCASASAKAPCGFGKIVGDARARLRQDVAPAGEFAGRLLRPRQRVARIAERPLSVAPGLPRGALAGDTLAHRVFRSGKCGFGGAHLLRRSRHFRVEFGEPVLLRQALRRGGRRIGARGETVPAPQRAFLADQALAGLQQRLQPAPVRGIDDADLRQTPGELTRAAHDARQAAHAFGQRRVRAIGIDLGPMRRRAGVERRIEIFAECCAERRLIAAIDR